MVLKILPRDSNRANYELKVALMSSEGLSNTANVLSVEYSDAYLHSKFKN